MSRTVKWSSSRDSSPSGVNAEYKNPSTSTENVSQLDNADTKRNSRGRKKRTHLVMTAYAIVSEQDPQA